MEKLSFKMKLQPEYKDEYLKRHTQIWPEMKLLLKENGISDCGIFYDDETFATYIN